LQGRQIVSKSVRKTSQPGVVDRLIAVVVGNVRIRTRLAVSFFAVLSLLAVATWIGLTGLDTMYRAADTTIRHDVRLAQHAATIGRLVVNERRYEKDMILNLDHPENIGDYRKKWDESNQQLDKEVLAARELDLTDKDVQALDEIQKAHGIYTAGMASVAGRIFDTLNTAEEVGAAMEEYKGAVEDLERASDELNARAMAKANEAETTLSKTQASTRVRQLTLAGSSLVLGVLFCLIITRSITRPLRRALDVSGAIANGRFDNEIEGGSRDETGELLGSLGQMQAALLESELNAKGQLAMIGQMQAVAEYTPDGVLRSANENFLKIFGASSAEVTGKPHGQFVDAGMRASDSYREFWRNLQRGKVEAGQFRRVRTDGTEVWLQGMYSPILGADGAPFKVVCYLTDVTAERRAAAMNAAFRGALDNLDANVMVADNDMSIVFVNPSASRMLKAAEAELRRELPALNVAKLTGSKIDAMTREASRLRDQMAGLNGTSAREEVIGGRVLKSIMSPMLDADGRRLGTVLELFDRTQEVATERELQDIIGAVTAGDLDRRIALEGKTGVFEALSRGINELVENVDVLAREIQSLVTVANRGDLTRRIQTQGKAGLLSRLGSGINELTANMAGVVSQVKDAAAEVYRGVEEISAGNLNLSQRTEAQAGSLEETASSMEEMTSTVKQNAENASHASKLALDARSQAEKGGAVVAKAVNAMGEINEASKKIANIIGVIDEIAFQTNLLALNAAVEAARAGEQGRGFAVVASEVRTLAGRSATAGKEIKTLIQDSVSKVEEGSSLVTQSGSTLDQIVAAVKKVTDIVSEIAAASQEQSMGIDQVNKAVTQLDQLTQQNAALVEQASASSRSMTEQAHALNEAMKRYKVEGSAEAEEQDYKAA
jgi:methyl-accepting chemotaxis protein